MRQMNMCIVYLCFQYTLRRFLVHNPDVRPLDLRWRRLDPRTRQVVIYSPRAIPLFMRIAMQSYEFVRPPLWLRLLSIRWRRLCLCVFTHNTQRCRSALSGLFSPTHHSLFRWLGILPSDFSSHYPGGLTLRISRQSGSVY